MNNSKSVRNKLFSNKKVNLKSGDVELNIQDEVVDLLTRAINESDAGTEVLGGIAGDARKMVDTYQRADDMFMEAIIMLDDAASQLIDLLGEGNIPSSFETLLDNLNNEKDNNTSLLQSAIQLVDSIDAF